MYFLNLVKNNRKSVLLNLLPALVITLSSMILVFIFALGNCQERVLTSVRPTLMAGRNHYRIDTPFGKMPLFQDPAAEPVYQGKGTARGIKCDVWRQIRVNWPPGNVTAKTIWRWYFTQTGLTENRETQPVGLPIL